MTTLAQTAALDLSAKRSWRAAKSWIMTGLMLAAVGAVAVPLIAVIWSVIARGVTVAFQGFPAFFTAGPDRGWARRSSAPCSSPVAPR